MSKSTIIALVTLALTLPAGASEPANTAAPAAQSAANTAEDGPTAEELGAGLIYSVDRIPERTFETSRGVRVITSEDIWRKNATSLSDILDDEPGFLKYRSTASTVAPVLRGLAGRQVLLMIDGIKVNDAMTPEVTNMDLIDISQIERIEIVRGVVSVLGTESLGGVINVIMKKGPGSGKSFGGQVGYRYATGNNSSSVPVQAYGQTEKFRWIAGIHAQSFGNIEGPDGIGEQRFTDYTQRSGRASLDYFLSPTKTVSASYLATDQDDAKSAAGLVAGTSLRSFTLPSRLQLGTVAYQDLSTHGFVDSMKATAFWNVQDSGTDTISSRTPSLQQTAKDTDRMVGLNVEMGSFLGTHHLVYGADYTLDSVDSQARDINLTTGVTTVKRGRITDEATYQATGVYAQDRFDATKWLTITAGLRYGVYKTSGDEVLPVVGPISLDATNSDVTGALNFVFHATPNINLIANAFRGFRAPNLREASVFSQSATSVTLPNPDLAPERITSYEVGAKYENTYVSGSAFIFRNSLSNLLFLTTGTFQGKPFVDVNGDGVKQTTEPAVRANQNLGETKMNGYEFDFRVRPRPWLTLWGNYTRNEPKSPVGQESIILVRVPPPAAVAGFRVESRSSRWRPWGEVSYAYAKEAFFAGSRLSPELSEFKVAGGMTLTERVRFSLALKNLTDNTFTPRFTTLAYPGRSVTISTEFRY